MQHASLTVLALLGSLLWGYAAMAALDRAYGRIDLVQQETIHHAAAAR